MAHFVAILDPEPRRRDRFLATAIARLDVVDGLRRGRIGADRFGAAWVTFPGAPVEATETASSAAIVLGDAFDESDRVGVADVSGRCSAPPAIRGRAATRAWDGYHLAIGFDARAGLVVQADRLGLFPVFFASAGEVSVVSSSPEVFRLHPLFPARPCPEGLVALFLAHGVVRGRTLLEGVRRLAVGHRLVCAPGTDPVEEPQYEIGATASVDPFDFEDHLGRLHEVWRSSLDRQVPASAPVGLLLSGGRDSRLLAGYLADLGRSVRSLTLGRAEDFEARCAAGVARALGFEHRRVPVPMEEFPDWAEVQASIEHLQSGFSNVHTWAAVPAMRELGVRCVNGYLREVREVSLGGPEFESFVAGPQGHGATPALMRRLLRPAYRSLVDQILGEMREDWTAASADPDDRNWRFILEVGARSHPGGVVSRFALGSWPVMPLLDRRVLELLASLPPQTLAGRRAQDALVRTRFASLARLPLDRNDFDTIPLSPTRLRRLANPALVSWRRLRNRAGGRGAERRYYHRLYDPGNAGWQAVRERAEAGRDALARLFDLDALREVVPSAESPLDHVHPIRDGFVTKLFLGLMLWARDRPV